MSGSIYFLSTVDPTDKSYGKGIVVSGLEAHLKKFRGTRPYRLLVANSRSPASGAFVMPGLLQVFANIAIHALVLRNKSIQECFYWKRKNIAVIREIFESENVELFVFDTIRTAQYIEHLSAEQRHKSWVYLDDLFSLRYQRMLDRIDSEKIDPLGNFARHIPSVFKSVFLKSSWLIKSVLQMEKALVQKSELRMPAMSRKALLINPSEVELLKQLTRSENIFESPPLLANLQDGKRDFRGEKTILFLGSLNLSHNRTGINEFLRHAFPEIVRQEPEVCLHIVGGGVEEDTKVLIERFPAHNVAVHGRVPSLEEYLSRAAVLVAPLVMGSGVKIKCIDALSYSLPIVATSIGAEGIPVEEYKAGIVADEWPAFAKACVKLFNADVNKEYSDGASKLFAVKYKPETVEKVYNEIFFEEK
jgi:glycosyltransferase involved in cell wall biosynthesis